jgi:hypothetical protein
MIDTNKYEGHTEGKWYAETGANGEVQDTATVEIVSFHSDEFREKWLADASLRHEKQQDEDSIGDRTEALVSILGQVYQPDDEGVWYHENNRLMLDDSYDEMQANMNLMADAPLILQALIDERAEVKRLQKYEQEHKELWDIIANFSPKDSEEDNDTYQEWLESVSQGYMGSVYEYVMMKQEELVE